VPPAARDKDALALAHGALQGRDLGLASGGVEVEEPLLRARGRWGHKPLEEGAPLTPGVQLMTGAVVNGSPAPLVPLPPCPLTAGAAPLFERWASGAHRHSQVHARRPIKALPRLHRSHFWQPAGSRACTHNIHEQARAHARAHVP